MTKLWHYLFNPSRFRLRILLHDLFMAAASLYIALFLRLGSDLFAYPRDFVLFHIALFVGVSAIVFQILNLAKSSWRYASLNDVMTIGKATTISLVIFTVFLFFLTRLQDFPRSTLIITWFIMPAFLGAPRLLWRILRDRSLTALSPEETRLKVNILLVGATDEAESFLRAHHRNQESPYRILGILTRRASEVGTKIHGINVLGLVEDLPKIFARFDERGLTPQKLVIANDLWGQDLVGLMEEAEKLNISVNRLPSPVELSQEEKDAAPKIHPIALEDLLGRAEVPLDTAPLAGLLSAKTVLVTGAGGSIGQELCRQIASHAPKKIILFDHSEYNLYRIDMDLRHHFPASEVIPILGDVRNFDALDHLFETYRPQIIFHAAALKHVPMVEMNPVEGLMTNVMGSYYITELAQKYKAQNVVMISTDKAVNPTNVMGASKRLAELYVQALDQKLAKENSATQFITTRFGNVLGSAGSVVPLFQQQLAEGRNITITHPDIRRFFMTIPEAVNLVLHAASWGQKKSETRGKIFVLNMGKSIRIVDLAKQMIRLAGRKIDQDVKIEFTGLRPGEKMKEELFYDHEERIQTDLKTVFLAEAPIHNADDLRNKILKLQKICMTHDDVAAQHYLMEILPDYKPLAAEESLDSAAI